ncbi:MAG: argininosuccinate synthase [Planctomycetota bacterium]
MSDKVLLSYSGGLDTAICLHWLRSVKGVKVITLLVNIGQYEYLPPLGEVALKLGAESVRISDLRDSFIKNYIWPALKANARYESGYLLCAALNRPLIASELISVAQEEGCDYVAHGSRGVGNDHIRLNNCIHSLTPELSILTPLAELNLQNVRDDIKYARQHHIPISNIQQTLYNVEYNLWGVNIQLGRELSDTGWPGSLKGTYLMTTPLLETPDKPAEIEISFKQGVPVSLDGARMSELELIETLNKIGGRHAIGRVELVENKISNQKSYEIYEAPAATILYAAHTALEEIVMPKDLSHFKNTLSGKYAELVYNGEWFSPIRESLDKFFEHTQEKITGSVGLKLFKGNIHIFKRTSPFSLLSLVSASAGQSDPILSRHWRDEGGTSPLANPK